MDVLRVFPAASRQRQGAEWRSYRASIDGYRDVSVIARVSLNVTVRAPWRVYMAVDTIWAAGLVRITGPKGKSPRLVPSFWAHHRLLARRTPLSRMHQDAGGRHLDWRLPGAL